MLEWLVLLVILLMLHRQLNFWGSRDNLGDIPNVSRIPFIGGIIQLSSFKPDNLHLKFEEFVTRFGKTFYAVVFGYKVVVTTDPKYVDALLTSHQHIHKNLVYLMLRSWLGDGLLLSHSAKWQSMRKTITPTFHFKILEQFVEVYVRQSDVLVNKLEASADGETALDIYPYMALVTLDVIAETAMGVPVNAQLDSKSDFVQAVKEVTNIIATRFMSPQMVFSWSFRLLHPNMHERLLDGIKTMHQFTDRIIESRRCALENIKLQKEETTDPDEFDVKRRPALLDMLLQSTNSDGTALTDEQIRDEVNTFMFEGHDTTSSAISFCLYLISRHPDCQRKLFAEIENHFGKDMKRPITFSDLQSLNYLGCVIKESLRVFPPVPAIGRWLKEDFQVGDVKFATNTNIIILIWQILRDPIVFPEPEVFLPERHMEDNSRVNAFSYIPFSAGPRNCIGQRFALLEMKTIVIKMLQNYELLPIGEPVQPSIKIVLRSKTGVHLGLKRRLYQ